MLSIVHSTYKLAVIIVHNNNSRSSIVQPTALIETQFKKFIQEVQTKSLFRKDSLVEETKKGAFVPDGRNDILTAAIGTPEHGGRVRGVGNHHKLSTFFGRSSSHQRQDIDVKEQLAQFTSEMRADFDRKWVEERKALQQSFMETLKSMGFSQTSETNKEFVKSSQKVVVDGSGKASCSAAKGSAKDVEENAVQKLLLMVLKLSDNHLAIPLSHCKHAMNFHMSAKCIRELLVGFNWLDLSLLQVWCT